MSISDEEAHQQGVPALCLTSWVKSEPLGLVLDVLGLLVLLFLEFGSFGSVFTYSNLIYTIFELPGLVSITFTIVKLPELILFESLVLAVLLFLFVHLGVPSCVGPTVLKFRVLLVVVKVRGSQVVVIVDIEVIRLLCTATVIIAGILIFIVSVAFVVVVLTVVGHVDWVDWVMNVEME